MPAAAAPSASAETPTSMRHGDKRRRNDARLPARSSGAGAAYSPPGLRLAPTALLEDDRVAQLRLHARDRGVRGLARRALALLRAEHVVVDDREVEGKVHVVRDEECVSLLEHVRDRREEPVAPIRGRLGL